MDALAVDLILHNGDIETLTGQGRVEAVAIQGGRFLATGSSAEILRLATVGTRTINLNRKPVIPGLIDAHVHWQKFAESLHSVRLYDARSRHEAVARVAERAQTAPPGQWIYGFGWSNFDWDDPRFPAAADLDTVSPHNPVYLLARSAHAAWVNSAALRLAGVDRDARVPEGSEILRDPNGEPTGVLLEWDAMRLVERAAPPLTSQDIAGQMRTAQRAALALGITGIHDFDDQECLSALQILREGGELDLRVVKNINRKYLDSLLHLGLRSGFGDDWLRLGAFKLFADGALGPHTAAMIAPYEGEPNNYGIVVTDKEDMREMVSRASANGFASTIHAIGDRAVHDVLDVFESVRAEEAARGESWQSRRHRVEHVQTIAASDTNRLAELSLIASMQPIHATSDYEMADAGWGPDRVSRAYHPRMQLDQGVVVAFGSDAPVDQINPLAGIHAAVTRRRRDGSPGPEGWTPAAKVTVQEALHGFTTGAAYAGRMEQVQGRIAPGFLADMVVLDRDLFDIPPDEIVDTTVIATMVGGTWRFGNPEG